MNGIILAAMLALNPGYNNPGVAGEIVAVNAATSNATATVSIKAVDSLTLYTNATAEVVSYETAWRVTYDTGARTYALPDSAFPITINFNGEIMSVTNNSQISYTATGDDLYSSLLASLFMASGEGKWVYAITDNPDVSLLFNGVAPVSNSAPVVSSVKITSTTNVVGYLDYAAFVDTNGVSTIVGEPVRFDMPITNTVVTARVAAQTYTATNALATVTTSGHFGNVATNGYIFGGGIVVEGATEGDKIKIIYK